MLFVRTPTRNLRRQGSRRKRGALGAAHFPKSLPHGLTVRMEPEENSGLFSRDGVLTSCVSPETWLPPLPIRPIMIEHAPSMHRSCDLHSEEAAPVAFLKFGLRIGVGGERRTKGRADSPSLEHAIRVNIDSCMVSRETREPGFSTLHETHESVAQRGGARAGDGRVPGPQFDLRRGLEQQRLRAAAKRMVTTWQHDLKSHRRRRNFRDSKSPKSQKRWSSSKPIQSLKPGSSGVDRSACSR